MDTEQTTRPRYVTNRKLWFGLVAPGVAWFALGLTDILLTWGACLHKEQFGGASQHPETRTVLLVVTAVLIGLVIFAGIFSYRNWRRLSEEPGLTKAEGRGRREFMALLALFMNLTLGVGTIWLALPLLIVDLCVRAR